MGNAEKEVTAKEVTQRLEKIAFYFEQRDDARVEIEARNFTGRSLLAESSSGAELKRAEEKLFAAEDSALSELTHLADNVKKYLKCYGGNLDDLQMVERFKLYRIASNYVNVLKHGTRGQNQKTAKVDVVSHVFTRAGDEWSIDDVIVHVRALINFEGELVSTEQIIHNLIQLWTMFLRFHTDVDTMPFMSRVGAVRARRAGQEMYLLPIPDGVLADAKSQADARKNLRIR